jgi:hypothetical protein
LQTLEPTGFKLLLERLEALSAFLAHPLAGQTVTVPGRNNLKTVKSRSWCVEKKIRKGSRKSRFFQDCHVTLALSGVVRVVN